MTDEKIPVSLVLGSGGARGLAHIGVIRALNECGKYQIKEVSGSSIGALIGGLYAAGKLKNYEEWIAELSAADVWGLLDFSFTSTGLFQGDRLMDKLSDLVGNQSIENLEVDFTAIASDIENRREIWLDSGPLFEAIRASIAIPGFFTPVLRDGSTLVDGGLLSPLPITPIKSFGAAQLVVVSLNGATKEGPELADEDHRQVGERGPQGWVKGVKKRIGLTASSENSDSAIEIMSKSLEAMQDRIARYQMAAYWPDVLIEIPVTACDVLDFHRAEEMIELGHELAKQVIDT